MLGLIMFERTQFRDTGNIGHTRCKMKTKKKTKTKQKPNKNTTQKTKKMINTDHTKKTGGVSFSRSH